MGQNYAVLNEHPSPLRDRFLLDVPLAHGHTRHT